MALGMNAGLDVFIPEIWTAALDQKLRSTLVYAQAGIINRNYEGEIRQFGDTVHVPSLDDVAVHAYTVSGTLTYDEVSGSDDTLVIDTADYWALRFNDLEKLQSLPNYMDEAITVSARKLAESTDTFVAGKLAAGVASGNVVGPASGTAVTGADDAVDLILQLKTKLDNANVPSAGRYVVVSPNYEAMLLRSDLFVDAASRGDQTGRQNGEIGRVFGFDVLSTTSVAKSSTNDVIIAGHSMACSFADQLVETESFRDQTKFANLARGLHVYGAKVFHGEALAKAVVTGYTA